MRIVEQEQAKIEERSGHRSVIHQRVFFFQMPTAWTHAQHSSLFVEHIIFLRSGEGKCPLDGVTQIDLTLN